MSPGYTATAICWNPDEVLLSGQPARKKAAKKATANQEKLCHRMEEASVFFETVLWAQSSGTFLKYTYYRRRKPPN
ncbi:hypothetical protein SAY87_009733 [Trapa incisa]|uniref:Uncharacterized protein n=1 Tax=Trapa incisa TaxID=236973 RepID=A0AAN7JWY9_9MYRT|nr:hypothetical protein SAY87_009733 [Trapa incisa]